MAYGVRPIVYGEESRGGLQPEVQRLALGGDDVCGLISITIMPGSASRPVKRRPVPILRK